MPKPKIALWIAIYSVCTLWAIGFLIVFFNHPLDVMQEESMDVSCVIIELKPSSLVRAKEWAAFILDNKEEALATLENEGVTIESFFFLTMESKDYLVGYMRAKSMEHAHEVVKHSLSQVDAYHQQFKKDAWVGGIRAELMFDLSRVQDESSFA